MNIGPMTVDLGGESNQPVVRMVQKLIEVVNGENVGVTAGALVATLVLTGKQSGAFSKADALKAVEETWEAIACEKL